MPRESWLPRHAFLGLVRVARVARADESADGYFLWEVDKTLPLAVPVGGVVAPKEAPGGKGRAGQQGRAGRHMLTRAVRAQVGTQKLWTLPEGFLRHSYVRAGVVETLHEGAALQEGAAPAPSEQPSPLRDRAEGLDTVGVCAGVYREPVAGASGGEGGAAPEEAVRMLRRDELPSRKSGGLGGGRARGVEVA